MSFIESFVHNELLIDTANVDQKLFYENEISRAHTRLICSKESDTIIAFSACSPFRWSFLFSSYDVVYASNS